MMRLGRVVAQFTAHLKQFFRLAIPRLQFVIGKGPCGRHAFQMRKLFKILTPIADQHRAVEFGIAADIVIIAGIERRTTGLVPQLLRTKEPALENGARVTVFRPVSQARARLQNENVGTRCGKTCGHCRAADPRSDDDNIRLSSQSRLLLFRLRHPPARARRYAC